MADINNELGDSTDDFTSLDELGQPTEVSTPEVQEEVKSEVPDKYRGKSVDDIIRMHQEAEKALSRKNNEVHEVRTLADQLIKQQLEKAQPAETKNEVDFFDDPTSHVKQTVSEHPDVVAARAATQQLKAFQTEQKLREAHPDYKTIAQDQGFVDWVKGSKVRLQLLALAENWDYEAADELLSTYKQIKNVKSTAAVEESKQQREKQLKAASVDVGGTGETPPKYLRRADILRLMHTDRKRYDALYPEILRAYAEGRVKDNK